MFFQLDCVSLVVTSARDYAEYFRQSYRFAIHKCIELDE